MDTADALGRQNTLTTTISSDSQSVRALAQGAVPFGTNSVESFKTGDYSNGSPRAVYDDIPRLYTWDERRRIQQGTDPSLRSLASRGKNADPEYGLIPPPLRGQYGWVSWESKRKRNVWFIGMTLLSLLPFISILIHNGLFNSALSWYTRGEINELTRRQKKFIQHEMWFAGIAWIAILAILIYTFTR